MVICANVEQVLARRVSILCGLPDTLASSYRKFGHIDGKASNGSIGGTINTDSRWASLRKMSRVLMLMWPYKLFYTLPHSTAKLLVGNGQTFGYSAFCANHEQHNNPLL